MKNILILLCFFQLFSCKKKGENSNLKQTTIDNVFSVDLNIKILEDDKLQLFFIQDNSESGFSFQKKVNVNVQGKDEFQVVSFKLPSNVIPIRFRLDLGDNRKESEVQIKSILIRLNNNVISVDNSTIQRLFNPNKYLITSDYISFERKIIGNDYDPYLLSTPLLNKKIEIDF
ncbi:hypothetical protein [Formosa sp. L2A11]|uniref:hypothetical protein n=1 Tax=Formosa sp. L2A11 TaxID=2686363 RepID=UPI00131B8016|nr:hypothetical protein [Formosa sp. L2A11]